MKSLSECLFEQLNEAEDAKLKELENKIDKVEDKADDAKKEADDAKKEADDASKEADKAASKGEETIKDEKSFREAARAKFEEVFKDDLDEKKMKETIDGLLKDHKDLVEKGDWAKLIGILNQSFAS